MKKMSRAILKGLSSLFEKRQKDMARRDMKDRDFENADHKSLAEIDSTTSAKGGVRGPNDLERLKKDAITILKYVISNGGNLVALLSAASVAGGTALILIYLNSEHAILPPLSASNFAIAMSIFAALFCVAGVAIAIYIVAPSLYAAFYHHVRYTDGTQPKNRFLFWSGAHVPFIAMVIVAALPPGWLGKLSNFMHLDLSRHAVEVTLGFAFVYSVAAGILHYTGSEKTAAGAVFKTFQERAGKATEVAVALFTANFISSIWYAVLMVAVLQIFKRQEFSDQIALVVYLVIIAILLGLHAVLVIPQPKISNVIRVVFLLFVMAVMSLPGVTGLSAIALRLGGLGGGMKAVLSNEAGSQDICLLLQIGNSVVYREVKHTAAETWGCPLPPFFWESADNNKSNTSNKLEPAVSVQLKEGTFRIARVEAKGDTGQ